jgi:hypothetical protein
MLKKNRSGKTGAGLGFERSKPTSYSTSMRRGLTFSALGRFTVNSPFSMRAEIREVSIDGSSS